MEKIDVLLISSPASSPNYHMKEKSGMPPLGLGYLATYLSQEKFFVRIIDLAIPSKNIITVLSALRDNKPQVVGFSASTETYQTAVRIANEVKKVNPNCDIVFGGYHTSFEYESALREDVIIMV